MAKSKSLVNYKIGYNPDAAKKTKSIEFEDNGVTQTFAIPVVSGDKEVEYQINEQLPIFFDLAATLGYTGPNKFQHFGQYLSGTCKSAWENELRTNFSANNQRTHQGFRRALIATWSRVYGQTDLRKGGIKYLVNLKWKKMHEKYSHEPVQYA